MMGCYKTTTNGVFNMTTFSFKMTDADIVTGIKSIGNRSRSLRVDIHKILCSMTNNWATDGAVNVCAERMTQLLNEIDGAHKQKLVNWANNFCSFTYEKTDDGAEVLRYDGKKTKLSVQEWADLKAVNMFDFTPDNPVKAFNFQQKLKALIKQAEKRMKADADKRSKDDAISIEDVTAAKALLHS